MVRKNNNPIRDMFNREIAKIKARKEQIDTNALVNQSRVEDSRRELIAKLFDLLKEAGVNLEDPASIAKFLQKMQINNPDMYSLFEEAFNNLSVNSMMQGSMPNLMGEK